MHSYGDWWSYYLQWIVKKVSLGFSFQKYLIEEYKNNKLTSPLASYEIVHFLYHQQCKNAVCNILCIFILSKKLKKVNPVIWTEIKMFSFYVKRFWISINLSELSIIIFYNSDIIPEFQYFRIFSNLWKT